MFVRILSCLVLAVLLFLGPPPAARAATPGPALFAAAGIAKEGTQAPLAVPLALTVSGGVSLGAYEAGFLYYHLQMLKQTPELVQLKGATGASAGSLNALLALLDSCNPSSSEPHESLFWRVWIPIGMQTLYDPEQVSTLGLFSRDWMQQVSEMVYDTWQKGLPKSCDVAWGVAVTRLYPRNVTLARNRLDLPRIEEKFTLRIVGQGMGQPPVVRNFFDPMGGIEQTMLLEDAAGEVAFSELRDVTFASCSFPLAFTPMALRYCVTGTSLPTPVHRCNEQSAALGLFIDGGVLDNSPLRLMARTMASGLEVDGNNQFRWHHRAKSDAPQATPASATAYYMFVSPDAADYPVYEAVGSEPSPSSATALIKQVAATFVSTARTKELYTLLEEHPELRDRIFLPRRHVPTASGLMSAFFGFFERDLRIFDFYLGMYDARRAYEEDVRAQLAERFPNAALAVVYPEDRGMGTPETAQQWLPLVCLRGLLDQEPALLSACGGESMRNFRILAQTSLTRLYDTCARLDLSKLPKTSNDRCIAAEHGEPPPRVADVTWPHALQWRRGHEESELEYLLRLMGAHQFQFTDLGLQRRQSGQALYLIREKLALAGAALSRKQPLSERNLVQLGADYAVDYAAYAPPRALTYASFARSVELGMSFGFGNPTGRSYVLRLDAPLWFDGLFSWMTSSRDSVSVGPGLGIEMMYSRPKARWMQWRSALRAGFMFSAGDSWLHEPCDGPGARTLSGCSRPRLEWAIGLTALEHLRLQISATWLLPARHRQEHVWAISPGIGLQF